MTLIDDLCATIGAKYIRTGADTAPWQKDWMGAYHWQPLAVVHPKSTEQVAQIVKICTAHNTAMVPVGGHTGLTGATVAQDAVMISLDRMNQIRRITPDAQVAVVEAGAVLQNIHTEVDQHDLIFPLFFGARGSAMLGGALSTNAGGSNVLRYGNTRDLCLGLEVVTPTGDIMTLMSELRKDNTGLNLKHLFIGAEGTLGIITAATLRLFPKPKGYVTAMVGLADLRAALPLLNRLQQETCGGVEAFEFMPRRYIERHIHHFSNAREPFDKPHAVNILVEIASTRDSDFITDGQGTPALTMLMEQALADLIGTGGAQDAVIAQNDAQRTAMWARREAAAEITLGYPGQVDTDVAVPIDTVPDFLERVAPRILAIDPGATEFYIAHLGDGNLHYTVYTSDETGALKDPVTEIIEDVVLSLGGSFSAEHGIGLSKRASMARRKDPVALQMMRQIKEALDPKGLMNPGKLYPNDDLSLI
ncbi:MAG: FAD-binding oxidoreductase [Pseudomonadota bacterium]